MKITLNLLKLILTLLCLMGAASAATYFTGTLSAAQEVPPKSSAALGFGRVTLNDAETQITYSLDFSGLTSNQTAAHIHGVAVPGANAPVLFNIGSSGATSGTFTALTAAVTAAQVADLKAGRWYFNVHSQNFGSGEIRGQITVDAPFVAALAGYQESPQNASTAIGFGGVSLNATETQIVASMNFSGLGSNQIAAHIHGAARTGVNAPVLFNIGSSGAPSGAFTDLFFSVTPAQALQLKTGQFYFNVHSQDFPGGEIRGQIQRRRSTALDFDGDSKTDFLIVRPTGAPTNVYNWYMAGSAGGTSGISFGSPSVDGIRDLMGGDFNGDGREDICVWRSGAFAYFYILESGTNTFRAEQLGTANDDPRMIYDYDGDGRADPAVWRDGSNAYLYYRASSAPNPSGAFTAVQWGADKDKPFAGDFDGDGKGDICVSRQFTQGFDGIYYCLNSKEGIKVIRHGTIFHHIAPGDYDGDGKTDIGAVRNLSNANFGFKWTWHPRSSLDGLYKTIDWGASHSFPSQGDYDGDGKTDIAVWQAASGISPNSPSAFYVVPSGGGSPFSFSWGLGGDIPINGYNVR